MSELLETLGFTFLHAARAEEYKTLGAYKLVDHF